MVEAGDRNAADVVVVQRSAERKEQSSLIVSRVVKTSFLFYISLDLCLVHLFLSFWVPLGIYHLISHRWEALAPPTHTRSHACKYAHTLMSLITSVIKVACTRTHTPTHISIEPGASAAERESGHFNLPNNLLLFFNLLLLSTPAVLLPPTKSI